MPSARHICIKVPAPQERASRITYSALSSREEWVRHRLGDGIYVGRPKNDGGWFQSPTVKAGSMFANPFPLKEYAIEESLSRYRNMLEFRASPLAARDGVIALLPPAQRALAERRYTHGGEHEAVGKSIAHLQLNVVGPAFREQLKSLRGKRLGCFCAETDRCHAKVIAELADAFVAADDESTNGPNVGMDEAQQVRLGEKRKCGDA